MERLTEYHCNVAVIKDKSKLSEAMAKLAKYEDLEDSLFKVYGECELLETAVKGLVKYEGADIGKPNKSILLTDEDADKWERLKVLEEQGLLLRLPCKIGDTVYTTSSYLDCDEDECVNIDFCVCEEDGGTCEHLTRKYFVKETNFQIQMIAVLGKTVFLTKAEAEEALKKMEG